MQNLPTSAFNGQPTRRQLVWGVAASLAAPATRVWAQSYPNKPIRLIVAVAPGGGADFIARNIAERLSRGLNTPINVDNISGGGGAIASQTTARAAADGYTLMQSYVATHGTGPATRKLPFDALADFTHIGMMGMTANMLVVPSSLPVSTVKEFIDYAKKNIGKLSYGSAGAGSLTHLAMEQFKAAADVFAVHIPYRGIAPALNDMFTGSTQAMMPSLAAATPQIKAGRLKPLAITGSKRHPNFPQVPTLEELGYKGFDGQQWYGLSGPARLPAELVSRLSTELAQVLAAPDLRQKLAAEAVEPTVMSPQVFSTYVKEDIARWSRLVKERNLQIEAV
jgi:tripartite-type tricarboxylate transporter receptor subunit TctC